MEITNLHHARAEALTEAPHTPGPDPTTAGYLAAVGQAQESGGIDGRPLWKLTPGPRASVILYSAPTKAPDGALAPPEVAALGERVVILSATDGTTPSFASISIREARQVAFALLVIADEAEEG